MRTSVRTGFFNVTITAIALCCGASAAGAHWTLRGSIHSLAQCGARKDSRGIENGKRRIRIADQEGKFRARKRHCIAPPTLAIDDELLEVRSRRRLELTVYELVERQGVDPIPVFTRRCLRLDASWRKLRRVHDALHEIARAEDQHALEVTLTGERCDLLSNVQPR